MATLAETLAGVPLLAELDPDELVLVANAMQERTFRAGEVVTAEGAAADGFFLVASGEATVTVEGVAREPLRAGDWFGEIALLTGSERTATVTAADELRCWVLAPLDFRDVVEASPSIAWKLLQSTTARLE